MARTLTARTLPTPHRCRTRIAYQDSATTTPRREGSSGGGDINKRSVGCCYSHSIVAGGLELMS